ncbi:MAG: hypothetical protein U0359_38120, partial [Byssovorax sp.]
MSKVVGHGRIRVDARKAVEKLREHLLVDLQLYPLEIVRAAVAGGAREVDVSSDGGTVGITFDGAPPPAEALPRLLDHVLDVSPEREARRLRLLALGLNAALGLRPASVDLTLSTDEGCTRVRWTPDLLDAGAGGSAAPLPAPEVVPRPEGMPPRALRIEVRPRFGWGAIRKALGGGLPREVELLLDATFALPARLTVGGAPPPPRPRSPPLLAVPFDARGAVRAALEIVPIGPRAPEIEILEHGVLMLRAPVRFALAMPGTGAEEAHLPIRIVVDAEELPVNLSRSALREDSSFCQPIERAAVTALAEAVRRWAGERADGRPRDRLPEPTRERAIERAMAAILGRIGRLALRGDSLPPELAALLDLPLCRSAYGGPLSIAAINALPAPLSIHREPEPLSEALRPFLGEVLRVTDALAEELAGERAAVDVRELLDEAEVGVTLSRQLAVHDRDAARLLAARADLGELGEEVRITFAALSTAIENLGATSAALPRSLLAFAGLSELPIWPTVEPGRRASIAALKATAERCGALFSAAPGVKGRAADGRLVLAVADDEIRPIAGALGVPIIPYGDGLIDPGDARAHEERSWHRLREALAVEAGDGPALAIARPGLRARVAVSASPRVRLCHAGEALGGAPPPPDLGALAIAVDSDALVPNPGWTAPLAPPSQAALSALLQPIDQAYCERLVAALEGDPAARAELDLAPGEGGAARDRLICNYLLDRAGHLRALPGGARPERAALAARIEALPLISVLDEEGRPEPCALADLARWHPAPLTIPALQAPPGFATLGWRPVLLHAVEERALLQRWSNERLYLAIDEIPGRKRDAERERLRRELLTHPPIDPGDLGDLADPGAFSVQLRPEGGKRIALVAALPRA